ncbi:glycine zipper 2TM domain-containing protein [Dyella terrae]|uniref:Glycine zipper 2TM domain-containing protein n=3 Tax=Rhodanobacteraceae TaxID=1775411 RepID=A0A4R0Z302_9GAMM|nr:MULTISPECIES: glycine zipper 2TM domain-containing protein [Dyella]TBR40661.1 glycine zipper 2TM domain-containing protein [Dyella terrae]TCI13868.1 glycine zipper 2TM domain-containing protein [Dyella soli]
MTLLNGRVVGALLLACCFALLAACAEPQPRASSYGTSYSGGGGGSGRCETCGVVNDVQIVNVDKNVSPMGMVIGAVAGGLLGNTIGKGNGRTAATVVGAVAGGAVGNQVGKNNGNPDQAFQITIRLDDGRVATVTQADDPQVRRGDYVEVRNNRVYRR